MLPNSSLPRGWANSRARQFVTSVKKNDPPGTYARR